MLVAVFRDLRDLSGLNDLLNVLQSLLVRASQSPLPLRSSAGTTAIPYIEPTALLGTTETHLANKAHISLTESPGPGTTIIPILQIKKLMHTVK